MNNENVKSQLNDLINELKKQSKDKWLLHYMARRLPILGLLFLIFFAYKLVVIYLNKSFVDKEHVVSFALDSFFGITPMNFQCEYIGWIVIVIVVALELGLYKFYRFYVGKEKITGDSKEKEVGQKIEDEKVIKKHAPLIGQIMMAILLIPQFFLYANQSMALLIGCFYNGIFVVMPMLMNRIFGYSRSYERTIYLSACAEMLKKKIDANFFSDDALLAGKAYYDLLEKRHQMKFANTVEDTFYLLDQVSKKIAKE